MGVLVLVPGRCAQNVRHEEGYALDRQPCVRAGTMLWMWSFSLSWSSSHVRHHQEGPGQGAGSDEVAVPCVRFSKNKRSSTRAFRMRSLCHTGSWQDTVPRSITIC